MKYVMKEQRQKVQYLYYRDYKGDQRKFSLVHFIYFPFLWYGVNKWKEVSLMMVFSDLNVRL
jgi:hypothetical protein